MFLVGLFLQVFQGVICLIILEENNFKVFME